MVDFRLLHNKIDRFTISGGFIFTAIHTYAFRSLYFFPFRYSSLHQLFFWHNCFSVTTVCRELVHSPRRVETRSAICCDWSFSGALGYTEARAYLRCDKITIGIDGRTPERTHI